MAENVASSITAVLGPTNTGKTHRAVERMLAHDTGMIGFPLRLLAREIYDKITARIGESEVALVTGEEKRVPQRPRYWVCTVEAMPVAHEVDFLAVDEIQLMSHPERGHVFTDRLLHARGIRETWFLGADTVRPLVERLCPAAKIASHPRLSKLRHIGQSSLGALPPRSAVVAFSATRVYELAERLRQKRGGAAVVLGALSPRARNAQVALYQSGEVDYIVATDAIGMGLNLDLTHIAFADVKKFDGRELRTLEPAELGQIAGRAGRYLRDGTFGTLAPVDPLPDSIWRAIEMHSFAPERAAFYRNSDLDFGSVPALLRSLRERPPRAVLKPMEHATDATALFQLGSRPEILARATKPSRVSLLWDVCRIPDFRDLLLDYHVNLLSEVYLQLTGTEGEIAPDWMNAQLARVDDPEGDLDTLLMRMASVRTFTYVSHQASWLAHPVEWQERTRHVEDRLSDALHQKLVARFVDGGRRSRSGHRSSPRASRRPAPVEPEVTPADGHPFAELLALRNELARKHAGPAGNGATAASDEWFEELVAAPHARFRTDVKGVIHDAETPIGKFTRGPDVLRPDVTVTLAELEPGERLRLHRRLVAYGRDLASEVVAPLKSDLLQGLGAPARGLVYQLTQHLGTLRMSAATGTSSLPPEDVRALEEAGLVLGRAVSYLPGALDAVGVEKRAALLSAFHDARVPAPDGPSTPRVRDVDAQVYTALGYPIFGPRGIRADVAERIFDVLSAHGDAPFVPLAELATWLGCPREETGAIVAAFGYRTLSGGRFVRRAIPRPKNMRTLALGVAVALLVTVGCKKKADVSVAPAASGATAQSDCESYATALCNKAGADSDHCHAVRDLKDLLPAQACVAGLANMAATEQKLAVEKKPCTELAERLCKDIGPETESCKMVRTRTPTFPASRCIEMAGQYAGVLGELQKQEEKLKPLDAQKQAAILAAAKTSFGSPEAKVKLVEFSDFQCPFCAGATKSVDEIRSKYGDKVYFVFRQFPLPFHENAHLAAEASLAAAAQGKFWPFHDMLFKNQANILRADLDKYAQAVGLDMPKFKKALDTGEYKAAVDQDASLGKDVNVEGTPTLFVNGKIMPNVGDTPALIAAIDAQLK